MDNLTAEQRHYNMSRIKAENTKPEVLVRSLLFRKGLRFRKNDRRLPGHPDIVLPKYRTVVFVNGCFWHGHENCRYASVPKTNVKFWETKIKTNVERDERVAEDLRKAGWNVITVWECMLKQDKIKQTLDDLYDAITGRIVFTSSGSNSRIEDRGQL